MTQNPVIQGRVAGAGVESQDFFRPADPGYVGNPANIEDSQGKLEISAQRRVKQGHKRCALPAGGDVGRAKIPRNRSASLMSQRGTIAQLYRYSVCGLVEYRLTVKSNYIYISYRYIIFIK